MRDIEIKSFIKSLESLPDHRDNRGKRHELPFVLCSVVLAILSDRSTLSSIHRYIENRIGFLRRVTGYSSARVISRAQLPRILASVDRAGLSERTMCHFDIFIEPCADNGEEEWYGGDGKSLRGTADEQGEQKARTFLFVGHDSRDIVVQCEMNSNKEGEIIVARHLLEKNGLASLKITLDALHLNPETTALIALAGGEYLIQAKANQPILYETLIQVAQNNSPFATVSDSARGHGRQEERHTWLFNLQDVELDPRWRQSNINTLAVVIRQTISTKEHQSISQEISYYLSNISFEDSTSSNSKAQDVHKAIRRHWSVEVVNWIRDVTFQEDKVHTKYHCIAQTLATIRSFAIRLLQKSQCPNCKAAIETFSDSPDFFSLFLRQAAVL